MNITAWLKDTALKSVKTFAQTLAALLGAGQADIIHASWGADLSIAGFAAIACLLHNVNGLGGPAADSAAVQLATLVDIPNPRENAAESAAVEPTPAPAPAPDPTPAPAVVPAAPVA
jgi:hypothetical protein